MENRTTEVGNREQQRLGTGKKGVENRERQWLGTGNRKRLRTGNNRGENREPGGWQQRTTDVENREKQRLGTENSRGWEHGTKGVGNRERTEAENGEQLRLVTK